MQDPGSFDSPPAPQHRPASRPTDPPPERSFSVKQFSRGYTFKVLLLGALVLLLLIPLQMIRGLVRDRRSTARQAEADIMEAWGKELAVAGPVLRIPGIRREIRSEKPEGSDLGSKLVDTPFTLMITPEKLDITAAFTTEIRRRGIFSVPLFYGDFSLSGAFNPAKAIAECPSNERLLLDQAELVIALSSQKGIRKITDQSWGGQELFFRPGSRSLSLLTETFEDAGMYALLPPLTQEETPFKISISIQGGQSVQVLPVGQDTHVEIAADWGSPSFQGAFLPVQATMSDRSFEAQWDVSYISRDIPLFWKNDVVRLGYGASLFGVSFFRAIDTYALNTRAVKYAMLFLMVPFFTLFLLEIFTKKPIHPVPYGLCGIANGIFYLLLLSISEQMPFHSAYTIAAAAVTALMTCYSRSLLPAWSKSGYMGLVLSISYVLLYAVLNAESYALLIGSIGAFAVTALVMFLTRKLDWYGTGSADRT